MLVDRGGAGAWVEWKWGVDCWGSFQSHWLVGLRWTNHKADVSFETYSILAIDTSLAGIRWYVLFCHKLAWKASNIGKTPSSWGQCRTEGDEMWGWLSFISRERSRLWVRIHGFAFSSSYYYHFSFVQEVESSRYSLTLYYLALYCWEITATSTHIKSHSFYLQSAWTRDNAFHGISIISLRFFLSLHHFCLIFLQEGGLLNYLI